MSSGDARPLRMFHTVIARCTLQRAIRFGFRPQLYCAVNFVSSEKIMSLSDFRNKAETRPSPKRSIPPPLANRRLRLWQISSRKPTGKGQFECILTNKAGCAFLASANAIRSVAANS
jgi:hypothetical protein